MKALQFGGYILCSAMEAILEYKQLKQCVISLPVLIRRW